MTNLCDGAMQFQRQLKENEIADGIFQSQTNNI